jgi:hypothetical protein
MQLEDHVWVLVLNMTAGTDFHQDAKRAACWSTLIRRSNQTFDDLKNYPTHAAL